MTWVLLWTWWWNELRIFCFLLWMLQSVFHFLRIYLFPFLPSPSSTSERIPWYLDTWSSHLIYPLTLSLCPFHSVLYRTAESVNTTVTLLVLKYFNRFPCLQKKSPHSLFKEVHILFPVYHFKPLSQASSIFLCACMCAKSLQSVSNSLTPSWL